MRGSSMELTALVNLYQRVWQRSQEVSRHGAVTATAGRWRGRRIRLLATVIFIDLIGLESFVRSVA